MYTANVAECKKALRKIPTFVPFTASQLMWMVKDFTKDKKLFVTLDVVESALAKLVHAKHPYFFYTMNENGELVYWRDAAAFAEVQAHKAM